MLIAESQRDLALRQAALTERKLDTEVRRPADAARYKREQEAQANRNAVLFEAEGRSKASIADAEAAAERTRRTAGEQPARDAGDGAAHDRRRPARREGAR